jgi:hypothetical protein
MTGMRFRGPYRIWRQSSSAEGALNGLGWPDAGQVAATISFDAIVADDPSVTLRSRAQLVLAGRDGQPWCDRAGVVRALNVAATVLDTRCPPSAPSAIGQKSDGCAVISQ